MTNKDAHSIQSANLNWYADSVSGTKSPINDDSWLVFSADINGATFLKNQGSESIHSQDLIFVVSDGMGGGNAGNVASDLLTRILSALLPEACEIAASGKTPDYIGLLESTVQDVHHAINMTADKDKARQGMAATLTLAWFTSQKLYFINVGDSRLYLYRKGIDQDDSQNDLQQLSQDHTFAWRKLNRGELTEREFRNHPHRSALYQVMGGGNATVKAYSSTINYAIGDQFLLCSDGLIDGVWQKHIHSAFSKNLGCMSTLADHLMSRSINNDDTDDTTLITVAITN
ncbi:serine/threonine-protein phosphatase [Verrucomicrobiaceae bacterium N1E253]|uniref:Serine/threonine-protein phosphatase n=1 Tax=Oceaniferula marina TaxID=2748318 RepID=A0A851GP32_9BACT|nr:protein phosphatase 2C domain-containing protein [Oceaniferula marina]NWK56787.1 serine/threonine-protein phosphatase [Oceaniferula marina]